MDNYRIFGYAWILDILNLEIIKRVMNHINRIINDSSFSVIVNGIIYRMTKIVKVITTTILYRITFMIEDRFRPSTKINNIFFCKRIPSSLFTDSFFIVKFCGCLFLSLWRPLHLVYCLDLKWILGWVHFYPLEHIVFSRVYYLCVRLRVFWINLLTIGTINWRCLVEGDGWSLCPYSRNWNDFYVIILLNSVVLNFIWSFLVVDTDSDILIIVSVISIHYPFTITYTFTCGFFLTLDTVSTNGIDISYYTFLIINYFSK